MKPIIYYPLIGILGILLLNGCNKENESVAKFNNDSITIKDLNELLLTKSSAKVNLRGQIIEAPIVDSLGYQALEELMTQQALFQIGEEEKITPTKEDIDKETDFRKKIDSKFVVNLSSIGFSVPQIEKKIKIDIIKERLLNKGIKVTLADAEDYIKKNPQQFTEPASANLRWIYISDAAKKNIIDQELQSGNLFSSVATKYNEFPNAKKDQAMFPQSIIKAMPPILQDAVNKTNVGQTTSWLQLGRGFGRFYVESKTPEQSVKMDDTHKEVLRRELAMKKGASTNNLSKKVLDKIKSSKIEVSYSPLQQVWKRFEERLKEAKPAEASPK